MIVGSECRFEPQLKFSKIFALGARIAFDKHRNKFPQTHRRTFICRGPTLGFTPTSHSARRRIGTHLYWWRLLYYLFVCGCRIGCRGGALIFSNSEIMRKAWAPGRSGLIESRERQSTELVCSLVAGAGESCRLVRPGTYERPFHSEAQIFC